MAICFGGIIFKLWQIQVLNASQNISTENFLKFDKQLSHRGEIFDSSHNPLVLNRQSFDVYANTKALERNRKLQRLLRHDLKIKEASLSAILKLGFWRKIKDNISLGEKKKLQAYYPQYLNFEEEWVRYYPESSSSAYVLGFLGKNDAGQPQGYVGLEGYFNQELEGLPVINEQESDLQGIPFIGGILTNNQTVSGLDLNLTLDKNVQQIIEVELSKGLKRFGAKVGCAIIMKPYSGNIVAMSCLPGFDPQYYFQSQAEGFVNPLIAKVFEPGSTFKPLIVSIGLENKRFQTSTIVPETGPYQVAEYSIRTWNNQYRGKISVQETLEKSSNVGMVQLIKKIPKQETDVFFDRLGLRELTGIELEGEISGLIKERSAWYPIDYLTYSFGQGLAITPIQLLRAFNTLANGGFLVKPTLINGYYDRNSHETINKLNRESTRVFSQKTIKQMKQLLRAAVDNSEAYWPNKPTDYPICGKTGTAQIPVKGTYDPTKTVASFIGFLPCQKPEFISLVFYKEPTSSPWGSETAAPTFFDIARALILYYNIPPN